MQSIIIFISFVFSTVYGQYSQCAYSNQISAQIHQIQQQAQNQVVQLQNQAAYSTPEAAQQLMISMQQINENMGTTIQNLQRMQTAGYNNCYLDSTFGNYPYNWYTNGLLYNYYGQQQQYVQWQTYLNQPNYDVNAAVNYANQINAYNNALVAQSQAMVANWA